MASSKAVFTFWAPLIGFCLLLCFLIKEKGLNRPEEEKKVNSNRIRLMAEGTLRWTVEHNYKQSDPWRQSLELRVG